MVGCVKEIYTEPDLSSKSMTLFSDSQEWSLMIPADMVAPEVGWMIAISCHTTDSGLVLDGLRIL
jgi:hypothetical protein